MSRPPLLEALEKLERETRFVKAAPPVAFVYRPLDYAREVVRAYVEAYGEGPKEMLLLGMNPGPFGMGQTGVPFGEVSLVRDWMKLGGEIRAPKTVHPKRPVLGFSCTRSEVSGKRLWGAIATRHPDPRTFFRRAFVLNYCPLLFVSESGANVTPDKLPRETRARLEAVCDAHLTDVLAILRPRVLFGVGQYAGKALERVACGRPVHVVPHPSPASPQANRGWTELARRAFEGAGVDAPL